MDKKRGFATSTYNKVTDRDDRDSKIKCRREFSSKIRDKAIKIRERKQKKNQNLLPPKGLIKIAINQSQLVNLFF